MAVGDQLSLANRHTAGEVDELKREWCRNSPAPLLEAWSTYSTLNTV
jgi:hypothetical protein